MTTTTRAVHGHVVGITADIQVQPQTNAAFQVLIAASADRVRGKLEAFRETTGVSATVPHLARTIWIEDGIDEAQDVYIERRYPPSADHSRSCRVKNRQYTTACI